MEPEPQPQPPLHVFQNSKSVCQSRKRVAMEPDVIEISPLPSTMVSRSNNRRSNKPKQVLHHEVIDVDNDEDSSDCTILDYKIDTKNKGKVTEEHSDGYALAEEAVANYLFPPSEGSSPGSHKTIVIGGSSSDMLDSEYFNVMSNDFMDFDEYSYLQTHFDNVDIPPGVEAPVSCLLDSVRKQKEIVNGNDSLDMANQRNLNNLVTCSSKSAGVGKKLPSASSSGFQISLDPTNHASGANLSSLGPFSQTFLAEKKSTASQHGKSYIKPTAIQTRKIPVSSNSFTNYGSVSHLYESATPFGHDSSYWEHITPFFMKKQGGPSNSFFLEYPSNVGGLTSPVAGGPLKSFPAPSTYYTSHSGFNDPFYDVQNLSEGVARTPKHIDVADIQSKYQNFKRFDTVEDHSDHHYASNASSIKQPPKNWAKKVQEEWRILENDLPDTIFVRAYESRMDLLRAVIIGAEGTPYHDGLFFFDIFFPSGYPNAPPNVHYHSGGLRLNPNLYKCGKVCLSLLGTWHGDKNEKWLPGVSTVLQVLVSIQALILNQKPFFNEPGYASMSGSEQGERQSQQYNERTFILSLKTMVYTMRRPPKHFEDFVAGHFHKYAHDILVACKAYMDGAQVGCLVKGGVQDVDEGDKSCSKSFKDALPECVNLLLKEFSLIGVKATDKFQISGKGVNNSNQAHNLQAPGYY